MEVEGSYLVARTLKEEGVEHLFYLMGGPNYEIINNSEDFGIKVTDFRHEQAASMAAHAYARVTGKPGGVGRLRSDDHTRWCWPNLRFRP
jgi:acetolactate synthase-1/2/3 large subunit